MPIPDTNQKCLAGEYYVSSLLSRLGYAVAITIGNTKTIDIIASNASCVAINFQIKTTAIRHDWLVRGRFQESDNLLIALVRLGRHLARPELYFLTPQEANSVLDERYVRHSPRLHRTAVSAIRGDHDVVVVTKRLGI